VTLERLDVFDEILPGKMFDVIVANPPYISAVEFQALQPEVRDFEPRVATTDNADGLRLVRRVCEVAAKKLCVGGFLLMEVAFNQGTDAKRVAIAAGLADVEVFRDLAGNERMLQGRRGP
jgi:release factor glutamine methyltransferase